MSELISLRVAAGSQQGWVFGRQFLAKMVQTGCVGTWARGPGCSVSSYGLSPLLLGLTEVITIGTLELGPREFHQVACRWQKGMRPRPRQGLHQCLEWSALTPTGYITVVKDRRLLLA